MENKNNNNGIETNVDLNVKNIEIAKNKNKINPKLFIILGLILLIGISFLYLSSLSKNAIANEAQIGLENPPKVNEDIVLEEALIETIKKEEIQSGDYVNFSDVDYTNLDESSWHIKYEDDNYYSIVGIDVSEFNGYCNFYTLKDNGYDFVMLRVGWRGYTEGGINEDKYFDDYYTEANDAGLKIGYYFFSQAISKEEAIEEANFVLERIKDKKCDMFVAYDMESIGKSEGRIYHMNNNQRTECALAFTDTIQKAGYKSMIYTNYDWATNYYNINDFENIPIWYAQYDGYPNVNFDFLMWQYTAKASIAGSSLKGRTDLNLMLIKK